MGGKGSARKRGCSLMAPNYRLQRMFFMGKRRGSTTPVPSWKVPSQLLESDGQAFSFLNVEGAKDFSVSARKLAAVVWEIGRLHSPKGRECEKDRVLESSRLGSLSDPYHTTVLEGILDPTKLCRCRRRESADCRKLLRPSSNLKSLTSVPTCLGQVDEAEINGQKSHLKDVYDGLQASKQLLEVLSRVWDVKQMDCTSTTLVSALRAELDRSCDGVSKLIWGQKRRRSEGDALLKQIKHSLHNAVPSVVEELEMERKLRRRGETLNKKTGAELAEAKASLAVAKKELESEKKARRKVEQVCEELAHGIRGLKKQFARVGEEVEKEREMFHLADLLREERVQMKLSEAKCLYEEQNAVVERLRSELAACLEGGGGFSRLDRRNEVERGLGETLQNQDKGGEINAAVSKEDEEAKSDDGEFSNSFLRGNAVKNGSEGKDRNSISEEAGKEEIISSTMQHRVVQENLEFSARMRLPEFT